MFPQKILKFKSPNNAIFSILGTKSDDKRECFFHSRKCSFQFTSHTLQSILTSNEQLMKTKLRTFAREQILRKPIRNLKKRMKYSVHLT